MALTILLKITSTKKLQQKLQQKQTKTRQSVNPINILKINRSQDKYRKTKWQVVLNASELMKT